MLELYVPYRFGEFTIDVAGMELFLATNPNPSPEASSLAEDLPIKPMRARMVEMTNVVLCGNTLFGKVKIEVNDNGVWVPLLRDFACPQPTIRRTVEEAPEFAKPTDMPDS
jgi:hypothetical protein